MRKTERILRKFLTEKPEPGEHVRVLSGKYKGRIGLFIARSLSTFGYGITEKKGTLLVILFPNRRHPTEEEFFEIENLEVIVEKEWKELVR